MSYLVVVEQAEDGSWSAYLPDVPGCVACGDSPAEARAEIEVAVALHLESLRAHGEPIPEAHAQAFLEGVAKSSPATVADAGHLAAYVLAPSVAPGALATCLSLCNLASALILATPSKNLDATGPGCVSYTR